MVPIAKGRKCQWACRGHLTREVFFVRRQCHLVPIIKEKNRPMTLSWGPILGGEKVKIALSCVPNDKVFCGKKCHLAPIAEGRRCQLPCSGNQTIRYIRVRRLYHLVPIAEKRMCLWACPGHETYEAFLQGHDAIWYQSTKGIAGQWVCFWHQSWREEGGNDPVLGIKHMTYFVRGRQYHLVPIIEAENGPMALSW